MENPVSHAQKLLSPECKQAQLPRVVIAGLAGDTGKSFVSVGLARALVNRGNAVKPFKKGPDFIDAAWLGAAARATGRNLDTFLMSSETILASLWKAKSPEAIAIIEGNRGIFDGLDENGSHSTAQLAKVIGAPVVLVVDVTKTTRTVAAQVLGCQIFDPEVNLAGIILNRVGTHRQETVIRHALAKEVGLPVFGAIPRSFSISLRGRHLGLVPVAENPASEEMIDQIAELIDQHVDTAAVLAVAGRAPSLFEPKASKLGVSMPPKAGVRLGIFRDKAFSFYYPENVEALECAGAELFQISPIEDTEIPSIDGLYIGGGFPEVYAKELSANLPFRTECAKRIEEGLPVWAECGGMMYLSSALRHSGTDYPMVGALPVNVEQTSRPQGHGYVEAHVDQPNSFLTESEKIRGHEFHYSHLEENDLPTVLSLERGVGVGKGRDGLKIRNVIATYTHLHSLATPEWAPAFVSTMEGTPA